MNLPPIFRYLFLSMLFISFALATTLSQIRAKQEQVRFARGRTSATLKGATPKPAVGDFDQYLLDARAKQTLRVRLKTDDTKAYVIIYGLDLNPPNDCLTCRQGDRLRAWTGALPANGVYSVQVYTESQGGAAYTLEVSIR